MAGCFGNSPYDKYIESELFKWLDKFEEADEENWYKEERYQRLCEEEEYNEDIRNDR